MRAVKVSNFLKPILDQLNRFAVPLALQGERALGADVHHQQLGFELLKSAVEIFGLGVLFDKVDERQVAFCVPNNSLKVVELKQTNVAVVILDGLLLKLRAILRFE